MAKKLFEHYKVLGLSPKDPLTPEALKLAYKAKCRAWHPDLFEAGNLQNTPAFAEEMFKKIQHAFSELKKILDMEGGQLAGSVLSSKDFYRQMGFDELADLTQETLVEINFERAAAGIRVTETAGAGESSTAGMLDSKIMQKMRYMAMRGPDLETKSIKIVDSQGHFTSEAIKNLLEFSLVYEKAETVQKTRMFLELLEYSYQETDERDVRLSMIIRDWVHDNYVKTVNHGWVHRSTISLRRQQLGLDIDTCLGKLGVGQAERETVISAVRLGNTVDASEALAKLYARFGGQEAIIAGDKKTISKDTREIAKIDGELTKMAARANIGKDELVKQVQADLDDVAPIVALLSGRAKELLAQRSVVEQRLSKRGELSHQAALVVRSLMDDVADLAAHRSSSAP